MADYGKLLSQPRSPWLNHRTKIRPRVRRAVYERDKWTCQHCGLVFTERPDNPKHAPTTHIAGRLVWLEMHHVIAYSQNGSDEAENLLALCSPCNNSAGVSHG